MREDKEVSVTGRLRGIKPGSRVGGEEDPGQRRQKNKGVKDVHLSESEGGCQEREERLVPGDSPDRESCRQRPGGYNPQLGLHGGVQPHPAVSVSDRMLCPPLS